MIVFSNNFKVKIKTCLLQIDDLPLFFTHQHRRSTKTLRLTYGLEGMKYIIQVYEGEINGHGEKEGLLTEYQYKFDQ